MAKPKSEKSVSLTVITLPLDALRLDERNARRHGERNLAEIKSSIADHGQVEPLIVQAGTRRIIAGHGRFEALKALGHTDAQVVELDVNDKTAALLGVRLNKTAELAEWDYQTLSSFLRELEPDELLKTGFADFEIEPLLYADWKPPIIPDEDAKSNQVIASAACFSVIVDFSSEKEQLVFFEEQENAGRTCSLLVVDKDKAG